MRGHQLGDLPNMIQPPLLGVVKAASAVSARTLIWRAPAVPRSCSMLSAVRTIAYSVIAVGGRRSGASPPQSVKVGHPGRANKAVPTGWMRRIVDTRFAMR